MENLKLINIFCLVLHIYKVQNQACVYEMTMFTRRTLQKIHTQEISFVMFECNTYLATKYSPVRYE